MNGTERPRNNQQRTDHVVHPAACLLFYLFDFFSPTPPHLPLVSTGLSTFLFLSVFLSSFFFPPSLLIIDNMSSRPVQFNDVPVSREHFHYRYYAFPPLFPARMT